jgi:hypothetical protein
MICVPFGNDPAFHMNAKICPHQTVMRGIW